MNEKRKRPNYTKEFKQDAIKLVVEQRYSCPEVARRLGSESGVTRQDLEAENRRLKKENKRLEMEREILKKAAAFFAKESN
jgi:transposase